ncbi:MAG: type II secretion system protein [Armatimonadetes bacterium]|nr:type II secretion system protein [Armatimonadota bacterium]
MRGRRSSRGFSLLELLVVIGIIAVLSAIILPVGRRLRENSRTSTCQVQLSRIGQALRQYYMDEGGVPPIGCVDANLDGQPDDMVVDPDWWPQLEALWRLDYLQDRKILHCPRHTVDAMGMKVHSDSPQFYRSYVGRDDKVKPLSGSLKQFRYMPCRWATPAAYPNDYRRQLCQNAVATMINGVNYAVAGPSSVMPADDTIVTWCDRHVDYYSIGGHGQYIVLYWDGSVQLLDEELFRDDTVAPAEAWLVKPTDIAP